MQKRPLRPRKLIPHHGGTFASLASLAFFALLAFLADSTEAGIGTTAFSFLQIPVAARGLALGGSMTAIADDASMGGMNPAGFPVVASADVSVSRTFYWQDVTFDSVAGAYLLHPDVLIGTELIGTSYGALARTVERSDGTFDDSASGGVFDAQSLSVLLRAAYRTQFILPVKVGLGVRWVRERLDTDQVTSVMCDVGFIAERLIPVLARAIQADNISLGASVTQLGAQVKQAGLPTTFRAGLGVRWVTVPLLFSADIEWPLSQSVRGQFGLESWMWDQLALRLGYRTGPDRPHPTVGVGIKLIRDAIGYQLDYALEASDVLGGTHRISIGVKFQ